jgi:hypothetical protein
MPRNRLQRVAGAVPRAVVDHQRRAPAPRSAAESRRHRLARRARLRRRALGQAGKPRVEHAGIGAPGRAQAEGERPVAQLHHPLLPALVEPQALARREARRRTRWRPRRAPGQRLGDPLDPARPVGRRAPRPAGAQGGARLDQHERTRPRVKPGIPPRHPERVGHQRAPPRPELGQHRRGPPGGEPDLPPASRRSSPRRAGSPPAPSRNRPAPPADRAHVVAVLGMPEAEAMYSATGIGPPAAIRSRIRRSSGDTAAAPNDEPEADRDHRQRQHLPHREAPGLRSLAEPDVPAPRDWPA